ncbi:MAG: hypothetical protein ACLPRH_08955, partial [Syntrophobacteraceae bacterium]
RASGPALGNLGVPFRRIVRGPPARRWAILECRFAGLYAGLRPGAGQSWSAVSPDCTRHGGLSKSGGTVLAAMHNAEAINVVYAKASRMSIESESA